MRNYPCTTQKFWANKANATDLKYMFSFSSFVNQVYHFWYGHVNYCFTSFWPCRYRVGNWWAHSILLNLNPFFSVNSASVILFPLGKTLLWSFANLWRTFAAGQLPPVKKWVWKYCSVKAKKRAALKVIKDCELGKHWGWNTLFYTKKKFPVQALLLLYQITKGFTNGKQKQKGWVELRAVVLNEAVLS